MTDSVLLNVKVGDNLYVWARLGSNRIEPVLKITPSGRVITRSGTFNPNGYLRGDRHTWSQTRARPATADDIAGIYRAGLVAKLARFSWDKLNADDLKVVAAIVG